METPGIDEARHELHRVYSLLARHVFRHRLKTLSTFSFIRRRRRAGQPHGWYRRASRSYELGSEDLRLDPLHFLDALVHEMVHELADREGARDVAANSNYHNRRFRDLALEIGLLPSYRGTKGWGNTRPAPHLRKILGRCKLRSSALRKAAEILGIQPQSRWKRWACLCGPIRVPRPRFSAKCLTCGRRFKPG